MTNNKTLGDIIRRIAPTYATKSAYNEQLALFLAEFNHIELRISEIIREVLTLHDLPELGQSLSTETLSKQLQTLKNISFRNRYLHNIPIDKIKHLSEFRNQLAHGAFRIDHSDGSYAIVSAKQSHIITPEIIKEKRALANDLAAVIDNVWKDLLIDELNDDGFHVSKPDDFKEGQR